MVDTNQGTPQIDTGATNAALQGLNNDPNAAQQQQAASLMQTIAQGNGPSAAQALLNQQTATAMGQTNAMGSSGSGQAGQGLARRQAMIQGAGLTQGLGGQAATARAQEQLGGLGELGQQTTAARGQDIQSSLGSAGIQAGLATGQAQLQEQTQEQTLEAQKANQQSGNDAFKTVMGGIAGLAMVSSPEAKADAQPADGSASKQPTTEEKVGGVFAGLAGGPSGAADYATRVRQKHSGLYKPSAMQQFAQLSSPPAAKTDVTSAEVNHDYNLALAKDPQRVIDATRAYAMQQMSDRAAHKQSAQPQGYKFDSTKHPGQEGFAVHGKAGDSIDTPKEGDIVARVSSPPAAKTDIQDANLLGKPKYPEPPPAVVKDAAHPLEMMTRMGYVAPENAHKVVANLSPEESTALRDVESETATRRGVAPASVSAHPEKYGIFVKPGFDYVKHNAEVDRFYKQHPVAHPVAPAPQHKDKSWMFGSDTPVDGGDALSSPPEAKQDAQPAAVEDALRGLHPYSYRYKDPSNEPIPNPTGMERFFGIMTTDLKKHPVTRNMVSGHGAGEKIAIPAATSFTLASAAHLQKANDDLTNRVSALEKMLSGKGRR